MCHEMRMTEANIHMLKNIRVTGGCGAHAGLAM
jgi:hypothetical protein